MTENEMSSVMNLVNYEFHEISFMIILKVCFCCFFFKMVCF
jgi:hypothetical protein